MLTNLAMMSGHPEAIPNHIRLAEGVVQINDQLGFGRAGGLTMFGGTSLGIDQLGPHGRRQVTEQWGTDAITDPERLYDLQSLYRAALGWSPLPPPHSIAYLRGNLAGQNSEPSKDSKSDDEDAPRWVPLEVLLNDVPSPGWFHIGSKRDVPRQARYVGQWEDRYAWVTSDGVPALAQLAIPLLAVIQLKPGEGGRGGRGLAYTGSG